MTAYLATLALLARIALRNLFASRVKTLIVGGIILFGTTLVVVGSALLDSVLKGMAESIIGSVAGHIQLYSSKSKEELVIWGQMGTAPELAPIKDFAQIRKSLETIDNIDMVVPMGMNNALIQSGNTIDLTLEDLRNAIRKQLAGDTSPALLEHIASLKVHVRQMARVLRDDQENMKLVLNEGAVDREAVAYIRRANSDEFWENFDADPLDGLEFLENRLAPLALDADIVYLKYIGTDLSAFARAFGRMEIVDGEPVPLGQRGFLLSKWAYEERFKLKNAHRLDKIRLALTESGRHIAGDEELERWVRQNTEQTGEIVLQLDPMETRLAIERLRAFLATDSGDPSAPESDSGDPSAPESDSGDPSAPESDARDLSGLLGTFFDTNDANFMERYAFFYDQLAPLLDLYRIRIGDKLTIKAFTQAGFVRSINVKVYGTFQFKGLELAALAGSMHLMDLMSFRDLYGYMTPEKAREVEALKEASGVRAISRDAVEAELFGGENSVVEEAAPGVIETSEELNFEARATRTEELVHRVYSQEEIDSGVVLNMAVILKDPSRLDETLEDIRAVSARDHLDLLAVSWQDAAGVLGQLATLLRIVLFVAVTIIFVVALVIINNAMMMATLERVTEIGTLRAIGAQRRFILVMVFVETVVVGLFFGAAGVALGSLIVGWLGWVGIPATEDIWYFIFSGPRLYPGLDARNLAIAVLIVLVVSALSSFYPAWLATRVSPIQAIQTED